MTGLRPKLVLFDIDGTLLLTGGAGSRGMNRAFMELFNVADAFHLIPMPGRTDSIIVADALARLGYEVKEDELERFRSRYVEFLREELERPIPRRGVLPGVRELLDTLSGRPDVFLGLLSGNFAETARLKLEHFGLAHYFACGAYGDDAHDRNDLVPIAVTRSLAGGAPPVAPGDVIVVGDTPLDVGCARVVGARAIAVATGDYDERTLRDSGADVVFPDLRDSEAFLRAMDA